MTRADAHALLARYDAARERSRRLGAAEQTLRPHDAAGADRLRELALDAHKDAEALLLEVLGAMTCPR